MKPTYNIVQATVDKEGVRRLKRVGAMWSNTSRMGKTYYTLMIGDLKLYVFENNDIGEQVGGGSKEGVSNNSGVEVNPKAGDVPDIEIEVEE